MIPPPAISQSNIIGPNVILTSDTDFALLSGRLHISRINDISFSLVLTFSVEDFTDPLLRFFLPASCPLVRLFVSQKLSEH